MTPTTLPLYVGESIFENFTDLDGMPGWIIRASKGPSAPAVFILRQWDDVHGWGDRAYKTIEECRFHANR